MPWNDQSGGWKGGGNRGPWGQGPTGGGGPGGPGGSPDLEDILKKSQDRLKQVLPGGSLGGRGIILGLGFLLVIWGLSGFYRVGTDELGVETRFGSYTVTTDPGLNYHLPFPIESVVTPRVTSINRVDIGMRGGFDEASGRAAALRDVPEESLMLTGDENIVDVDFTVLWRINNARDFLFNVQDPASTVKAVAESSMREVVGRSEIQPILTQQREQAEVDVQELMQRTLDDYEAGILITQVQLQKVDPPAAVIDSFRDVQAARADQERLQNEAEAYANRVIPEARGEAARITEAAEAYRNRVIAEARGQASRFNAIYEEYRSAPLVTRQRMFLETMETVFGDMDKIIIDQDQGGGGTGVVPYLPLDQLTRPRPSAAQGGQ